MNRKERRLQKKKDAKRALSPDQMVRRAHKLQNAGNYAEAEALFRQVLTANPNHAGALHLLGVLAAQVGNAEKSVELIERALALQPSLAEAHRNLGSSLQNLGRLEESVQSFRTALSLKPDYADAFLGLGISLQDLGRLGDAEDAYRQAVTLDAALAEAHRCLAHVKKFKDRDADLDAMEKAFAKTGGKGRLDDTGKMHLAFGLGKAFEDLQDFEQAFDHFLKANTLRRQAYDFSITDEEQRIEQMKRLFPKDLVSRARDAEAGDVTPVFVLGMPRSGTSLVEQIIASHPNVHGAGELTDLSEVVGLCMQKIPPEQRSHDLGGVDTDVFAAGGRDYIARLKAYANGEAFVTDKTPHNFLIVGMIKLMLPHAKVIHCRRDPVDTCLSIFKNYFPTSGMDYAYDLAELGQFYKLYEGLMDHWQSAMPGFIHEVRYEDVVADLEGQARALLDFCGLEWNDACLAFHKAKRPVRTASSAQVRKPLYTSSVKLWKRYEDRLGPLLKALQG